MLVTAPHGPECGLDETPKRSGPTPKDTSQGEWESDPTFLGFEVQLMKDYSK
jgi:hypothetical protein